MGVAFTFILIDKLLKRNILFKNSTIGNIDKFLVKYITKLPDDVIKHLSTMNNIVLKSIFSTMMEYGIPIELTDASFNPEDFKKPLEQFGSCLLQLYEYIY